MAVVNRSSLENRAEDDSASKFDRLCDYVERLTATTGLDFVMEKDMPLVEYHNARLDLCATSLGCDESGNRWCVLVWWNKNNILEGNIVLLNDEVKRLDRENVRVTYEEKKERIRNIVGSIVLTIGFALGTHELTKQKNAPDSTDKPAPMKGPPKKSDRLEFFQLNRLIGKAECAR